MDLSIFSTPEAWISLITLIFLEIVLGIDNLVFISITSNRLPADKQHIGRKLGLAGALIMRVIFLCFASYLVHMTEPVFEANLASYSHGFSIRDLVLLAGGGYLIYKGIAELVDTLNLTELKADHDHDARALHLIGLPQAVGTIMVMDIVFSIDSVITAVGMAQHLIIMVIAVMLAVFLMMAFIDQLSDFINGHPEMKMLALTFIVAIGVLLVMDATGFHTGMELIHMPVEKLMVYFAMVFCIVLEFIQMRYNARFIAWKKECWAEQTATQIEAVREEMSKKIRDEKTTSSPAQSASDMQEEVVVASADSKLQPVIIGNNVYVMMPLEAQDAKSFKALLGESGEARAAFDSPIELEAEVEDVPDQDNDQ